MRDACVQCSFHRLALLCVEKKKTFLVLSAFSQADFYRPSLPHFSFSIYFYSTPFPSHYAGETLHTTDKTRWNTKLLFPSSCAPASVDNHFADCFHFQTYPPVYLLISTLSLLLIAFLFHFLFLFSCDRRLYGLELSFRSPFFRRREAVIDRLRRKVSCTG